jgi:hypothetical protein
MIKQNVSRVLPAPEKNAASPGWRTSSCSDRHRFGHDEILSACNLNCLHRGQSAAASAITVNRKLAPFVIGLASALLL